jgi:hypothetical protein
MHSVEQTVMEPEGRERLLAAALTAVLRERVGEADGCGVVIDVDGEHYMFFTDGDELHMTTVDKDDPSIGLGTFGIDRKPFTVN